MGKNYVLKDRTGRPGGYLLESGGSLCCRVQTGGQRATLIALFEGGVQETYTLSCGDGEQTWPCGARGLCGGGVFAGDRLLLSSGEAATRAWERRRIRPAGESVPRRSEAARDRAAIPEHERHDNRAACEGADASPDVAGHERRWPPPPCWPEARYAGGHWQEGNRRSDI